MSNPAMVEEIAREAEALNVPQQQRVLAYIRSIKARPPGKPPESLLRLAGAIRLSDCLEIENAINAGCGQVNLNAW
jgi:hypothetical protein